MDLRELTIRLKTLDGQWETVGADRLRGVAAEHFQATANRWGSDTCTFQLRRDPGAVQPDLSAFTPCRVWIAGAKCWSGRVKETPTQDGDDSVINVVGEGMQYHLDDDVYERIYVHTRLADWRDVRTFPTADLNTFRAPPTVQSDSGTIVLGFGEGTAVVGGQSHAGVLLDLGPSTLAQHVVVKFQNLSFVAGNYSFRCRASDSIATIATGDNLFSGDPASLSSPQQATLVTPRRYIGLMIVRTGASGAVGADSLLRVTSALVASDPSYVSSFASVLKADMVVEDAIDQATLLLSSDRSEIKPATFSIEDYAPVGARSPREVISGINAYENYETKVDVDDRVCFRPRVTAPLYEIGEWSGAEFSDASTNSGDEIFNRAEIQATGPDGSPLAHQVVGTGQYVRSTAITHSNPTFVSNTTGWTAITTGILARDTTNFDTAPAGLSVAGGDLTAPNGGVQTTAFSGTWRRGRVYRVTVRSSRTNNGGTGGAPYSLIFRFTLGTKVVEVTRDETTGPRLPTFETIEFLVSPVADTSSAKLEMYVQSQTTEKAYIDSLTIEESVATLLDRRGFMRTKILPIQSAVTTTGAQRFGDLYLAAHRTTPFRGGFQATGQGGIRRVLGGGSVHPGWLLRDTGQLVRCSDRPDPDSGAWTRKGRIDTVSYDHDAITAIVALDEDRAGFETLLSRYALIAGQAQ